MVGALDSAAAAVTDSGGVQQENTVSDPCVTPRAQTEWPSTVNRGTNRLAAWPPTVASVVKDAQAAIDRGRLLLASMAPPGWDGRATSRIS